MFFRSGFFRSKFFLGGFFGSSVVEALIGVVAQAYLFPPANGGSPLSKRLHPTGRNH
jgi:hypothetical protein